MLRALTNDVWTFDRDLRVAAGFYMPARSTIVRLSNGKLVVHSPLAPLAMDDATARSIEALGEVTALVAPNCLHWLSLQAAAVRWPRARVFGAPGLERKKVGIAFTSLPSNGAFEDELMVRRVEGMPNLFEHVFLHPSSRTLIVTDLVFNVHRCRGFAMPLALRCVGAWKKLAQSRALRFMTKDRERAAHSVLDVLAWDFDRLIMAHGDIVESDARQKLADALAWMTNRGSKGLLGAAA